MNMRILIYNWIQFDEKENKGGGVTVYTKNLIEYLSKNESNDIYFLSSGRAYDNLSDEIRYEKTLNCFDEKVKSYQIVNSPVLSSARLSFPYLDDVLYDQELKKIFRNFINEMGGFDVIHFQNIEGLSISVFELKKEFSDTKFIYSMHNYYPICPQVMLWKANTESCAVKETGKACLDCIEKDIFKEKVIFNMQMQYDLYNNRLIPDSRKIEQKRLENACQERNIVEERKEKIVSCLDVYRIKMREAINLYMDHIIAVSERVKEIAISNGYDSEKIILDYIGTKIADSQVNQVKYKYNGGKFRICYLGYPRKNKGFFFLIDAINKMPENRRENIEFVIAAPLCNDKYLRMLREGGITVIHYQGYQHNELEKILDGVHLGIVPPLWEDNLPQVAIEFKSFGIPVLCSDKGGAKELSSSKEFVFEADNISEFQQKFYDIVDMKVNLEDYYKYGKHLITMKEHVSNLIELYSIK